MSIVKPDPWLIRNTKRLAAVLRSPGQVRYIRQWVVSFKTDYTLNMPLPWFTFDAINYLAARIAPGWRVFEYGSGGSTLFWLKHGTEVVSIEHDSQWFERLREHLRQYLRVDYRLVLPEPGAHCDMTLDSISDPHCYLSSNSQFADMNFRRYASQIDEFPDQYFDMVVVDGRARPSCVMHSISKVKIGGLLVLDNADRDYYLKHVRPSLAAFAVHQFRGAAPGSQIYTQTNVYVRRAVE